MPLTLETTKRDSASVLTCRGRIVFGIEADDFRGAVLLLLRESNHVILDFAGVTHMDSAGIGSLVGLLISAKNRHRRLSLATLSDKVRQVLHVAHVQNLFSIYSSVDDALAAGAGQGRV